jgi:hypothetical protein
MINNSMKINLTNYKKIEQFSLSKFRPKAK